MEDGAFHHIHKPLLGSDYVVQDLSHYSVACFDKAIHAHVRSRAVCIST